MEQSKPIKINVGGTKYEVSQSLVDRYPSSMLSKMCSGNWKEDSNEEIFVERNGNRFQYVLDYMRDARVELPLSVPRAQFVSDMEYFNLEYADENIQVSMGNPSDLFLSLNQHKTYFEATSMEINNRYRDVAYEKMACEIASVYFSQLLHGSRKRNNNSGEYQLKAESCFTSVLVEITFIPEHNYSADELQPYLKKYGLKADSRQFLPVYICDPIKKYSLYGQPRPRDPEAPKPLDPNKTGLMVSLL